MDDEMEATLGVRGSLTLAIVRAVRVDVYQTPQGKQTGGAARASSFEERPKRSRVSLRSIRT